MTEERITHEDDDIWADYDPERVRAALRQYAGSWSDLDADELKATIYRARDDGSRPIDRRSASSSTHTHKSDRRRNAS